MNLIDVPYWLVPRTRSKQALSMPAILMAAHLLGQAHEHYPTLPQPCHESTSMHKVLGQDSNTQHVFSKHKSCGSFVLRSTQLPGPTWHLPCDSFTASCGTNFLEREKEAMPNGDTKDKKRPWVAVRGRAVQQSGPAAAARQPPGAAAGMRWSSGSRSPCPSRVTRPTSGRPWPPPASG